MAPAASTDGVDPWTAVMTAFVIVSYWSTCVGKTASPPTPADAPSWLPPFEDRARTEPDAREGVVERCGLRRFRLGSCFVSPALQQEHDPNRARRRRRVVDGQRRAC